MPLYGSLLSNYRRFVLLKHRLTSNWRNYGLMILPIPDEGTGIVRDNKYQPNGRSDYSCQ